jgi:hypothetical protein
MLARLVCRILGHVWTGRITGWRNMDGAAIGLCGRCERPIVRSAPDAE